MPTIIVHQPKEYSQDLQFHISLDWAVHQKTSGYMDRDRWIKSTTKVSNLCITPPVNNKILFCDGHDSHFYNRELRQTK